MVTKDDSRNENAAFCKIDSFIDDTEEAYLMRASN